MKDSSLALKIKSGELISQVDIVHYWYQIKRSEVYEDCYQRWFLVVTFKVRTFWTFGYEAIVKSKDGE